MYTGVVHIFRYLPREEGLTNCDASRYCVLMTVYHFVTLIVEGKGSSIGQTLVILYVNGPLNHEDEYVFRQYSSYFHCITQV